MTTERGTGIDPRRMVFIFFFLAAIALGFFLEKVLGIVFTYARWADPAILGEDYPLTTVLGFAIAIATAVVVWRTPKAQTVAMEIAAELKKVTWPTLRETRAATVAVVIASAIAALILFGFDTLWAKLTSLVY